MQENYKSLLNEAFKLCYIYRKRYGTFPVRIGINVAHSDMVQFQVSPATLDAPQQDIPFFVDSNAKPGKYWLYNEQGKASTSTYLNAIRFVKLAMLPEAIQEHYRVKMKAI